MSYHKGGETTYTLTHYSPLNDCGAIETHIVRSVKLNFACSKFVSCFLDRSNIVLT